MSAAGTRRGRAPAGAPMPAAARRQRLGQSLSAAAATLGLAACATAPPPPGLIDLLDQPAQRALFDGLRAYEDGQYAAAQEALQRALRSGLANARDRATAHKMLAFIHCSSDRLEDCEAQFRAAREADPAFALGRAEAGHPLWGPVYRRVVPQP